MPSDTFAHSTTVAAKPEEVRAALERAETWSGIGPIDEVTDPVFAGDRLAGFGWNARAAGRTWKGSAVREDADTVRFRLDSSEIAGVIDVDVQPDAKGSRVTVTLQAKSKGFLSGMFWGVVADALRTGLARQVDEFGNTF